MTTTSPQSPPLSSEDATTFVMIPGDPGSSGWTVETIEDWIDTVVSTPATDLWLFAVSVDYNQLTNTLTLDRHRRTLLGKSVASGYWKLDWPALQAWAMPAAGGSLWCFDGFRRGAVAVDDEYAMGSVIEAAYGRVECGPIGVQVFVLEHGQDAAVLDLIPATERGVFVPAVFVTSQSMLICVQQGSTRG